MARSITIGRVAFACLLATAASCVCLCGMPCDQAQATSVGKAKITSIDGVSLGKVVVKVKKVKDAKGYEYRIGTNKAVTKNVKSAKGKKASKSFKGLKLKKRYFVKVRAYQVKKGKKVYGKWSKVRSVRFVVDKDYHDYCIEQGDYYKGEYEYAQQRLSQLNSSSPGIYDPFSARNDPTYSSRYSANLGEYQRQYSAIKSDRDYYKGLMNDWYEAADSQYVCEGYPKY